MSIINTQIRQESDGSLLITSEQDTNEIKNLVTGNNQLKLESGRSGRNQYQGDTTGKHRVARIPLILVETMMREGVWGDQERMRHWLNDPDNAPFRTTRGKL
ncbi:MAG: hypothetical protein NZ811_03655 [Gammaproteobacteria bacterium]|nr:hypothetical protein [Gammaproteobacteria bacterium]